MKKKQAGNRGDILKQWLKGRDLFNFAALCRRVDYDRGAFSHWLEGHAGWDMSDEAVERFENALIDYGYKKQ